MLGLNNSTNQHYRNLETHLRRENPLLVEAVKEFRKLDSIARKMGLLQVDQSYTRKISWWPLISVLGTFSAGKSSFINYYLEQPLKETGNQAVDDKFSAICYSSDGESRVLPGISLEADPRFPFYGIADEIEKVASGEGGQVNSYIQMLTCASENLKGQIFIDSPGFDADDQRSATLEITDYIIELSDLCLIFFDARHPEPGAMKDTLKHLVTDRAFGRNTDKFVYILNQIDTTAEEDNLEDVVAAWQRAMAREGMTAGKFFTLYNPNQAIEIQDTTRRERYERKRDADMQDIKERIDNVRTERLYKITGSLEKRCREIEHHQLPALKQYLDRWLRSVLLTDLVVILLVVLGAGGAMFYQPAMQSWVNGLLAQVSSNRTAQFLLTAAILVALYCLHMLSRHWHKKRLLADIPASGMDADYNESVAHAFEKNTVFFRSVFSPSPVGWGYFSRRKLKRIARRADEFIQQLNNKFARPSGAIEEETTNTQPVMNEPEPQTST